MSYTRTNWREGETPLSAQNMNNIEDGIEELQAQKVDKVSGKALSDQNYTAAEKTKLAGIAAGAEVNVQPDWSQTDTSADDYIQNKPVNATTSTDGFMSASDKSKLNGVQAGAQVNRTYTAVTGKPTSDLHPGFGTTIIVSQVAQNANGQISVTDRPIEFPDQVATTSERGLMTPADVTKLNGIATGATKNTISVVTLPLGTSKTLGAKGSTTIEFKGDFPTLCAVKSIEFTKSNGQVTKDVAICGFSVGISGSKTIVSVHVFNNLSENIVLHETYTIVKLICFS